MWGEPDISGVLDTNVLVYAHVKDSEQHAESHFLVSQARKWRDSYVQQFAVTPQILTEFYAVMTNPKRVTTPFTPEEALAAINSLVSMEGMFVLPFPGDLYDRTEELLRQHPVTGSAVFDVQLVATMLGSGIQKIYTFDRSGFEPFEQIKVITPG